MSQQTYNKTVDKSKFSNTYYVSGKICAGSIEFSFLKRLTHNEKKLHVSHNPEPIRDTLRVLGGMYSIRHPPNCFALTKFFFFWYFPKNNDKTEYPSLHPSITFGIYYYDTCTWRRRERERERERERQEMGRISKTTAYASVALLVLSWTSGFVVMVDAFSLEWLRNNVRHHTMTTDHAFKAYWPSYLEEDEIPRRTSSLEVATKEV